MCELWWAHHFNDVESSPGNIVAEHLNLNKHMILDQNSLKLQVACIVFNCTCSKKHMRYTQQLANYCKTTYICQLCHSIALHVDVILAQFLFDFLHTLRNIFGLKILHFVNQSFFSLVSSQILGECIFIQQRTAWNLSVLSIDVANKTAQSNSIN